MRKQQVFSKGRVQYSVVIKTSSFVPNLNRDFSVHVATARDVNPFAGVLTATVDHGIRQGFMQSHLDVSLASVRISKIQNEAYELIREWSYGCDSTWKRLSQLDEGNGMSVSRQKGERLSVSHSRNLHVKFLRHCS
jgi:hypothetical protein